MLPDSMELRLIVLHLYEYLNIPMTWEEQLELMLLEDDTKNRH